jgi:hypothetical protein
MAADLIAWNFTLTISNKLLLICVIYDDEPMQSDVLSLWCIVVYWYSSELKDLTASKFWGMMTVTCRNIIFDDDRKIWSWMTVNYQDDDRIQSVKCMPFEGNKNEGVQGGSNTPFWDPVYLNFPDLKQRKLALLWKWSTSSVISIILYYIAISNLIMVWL